MDSPGNRERQADVAHIAESIEQLANMVGLWGDRDRLEPCERRHVHRGVEHEQPVEFGHLLVGHFREQSVRRALAGASSPGNRGALDDATGRQDNARRAKRRDDRGDDGLPAIGAPGSLSRGLDHHR
jgi:hypothetical protein